VKISNLRSRRRDLFGDDLFGEPAWDILLSLLQSSLTDRVESVGSACLAAGVPQSTALRWLNLLESRGWVERRSDCEDGRRVHVRLTDKARSTLLELLSDTGG
jgi:DNA-binding MarR family transcriptional regulator